MNTVPEVHDSTNSNFKIKTFILKFLYKAFTISKGFTVSISSICLKHTASYWLFKWYKNSSDKVENDCPPSIPDLSFQELHVSVEEGVRGGQDTHRLHACPTLYLTLHRHVLKTCKPIVTLVTEVPETWQTSITCQAK